MVRERLRAWLAVQASFAFHPERARVLLESQSDPERLLDQAAGPLPSAGALDRAHRTLARIGALAVPLPSPGYPERLRQLSDAPPLLVVVGDPASLRARCVSLVGARAPTAYGRSVARGLSMGLARAGLVVVSGLARGIDAEVHRGALEAGGATLAFQGCGPDQVYPRGHRDLAGKIASAGAVVSEFPVGTPPRGPHFPLRNRLIAALAEAVVVIEARERSGSLVTARHAADRGVEVLAVPGPIDAPASRGTNRLIRDGAACVTELADVLQELGLPAAPEASPADPPAPTSAAARRVVAALEQAPLSREALGRHLGLEPRALSLALVELELAGRLVEDRDGCLRLRSPLRGSRL